MLSINTNLSSIIAQNSMKQSTNSLNQAIERMTTGAKINHSKDNAANYSISTNMTTKIGSYNVAEDNCAMGLDLLATAEGSLNLIQDKLTRLRSLAVTAQNGTYGVQSLDALETEAESIVSEIKREYANVEYNGIKLFNQTAVASGATPATFSLARTTNFDSLERVSEATSIESGKSYRIDDSTDLVALQDYVNGGGDTTNVTFELTKDIDMNGVAFRGIGNYSSMFMGNFNGNGNVIKNLTINTIENNVGLFGYAHSANINSVGIENCNITGANDVGGLLGSASDVAIKNCYVTGNITGEVYVGGLLGSDNEDIYIANCYSTSSVSGQHRVAGLIGLLNIGSTVANNFSLGTVSAGISSAGLIGMNSGATTVNNNYYNKDADNIGVGQGEASGVEAKTISEILAPANLESMGFTEANSWTIKDGMPSLISKTVIPPSVDGGESSAHSFISLQVGTDSSINSSISFDVTFDISTIDSLLTGGLTDITCINSIDNMLKELSAKSVQYGAIQNRLESVLEEIVISRDNLVSSRSTLRDADIAEVSSTYIKQQILQQASATLLATANQSPSIALQLI